MERKKTARGTSIDLTSPDLARRRALIEHTRKNKTRRYCLCGRDIASTHWSKHAKVCALARSLG